MNIIRKAIKRYKVRRMRRKLENQVIEPAYSIVCYREDGKAEIWMILYFFFQKLLGGYCYHIYLYQNKEHNLNSATL